MKLLNCPIWQSNFQCRLLMILLEARMTLIELEINEFLTDRRVLHSNLSSTLSQNEFEVGK